MWCKEDAIAQSLAAFSGPNSGPGVRWTRILAPPSQNKQLATASVNHTGIHQDCNGCGMQAQQSRPTFDRLTLSRLLEGGYPNTSLRNTETCSDPNPREDKFACGGPHLSTRLTAVSGLRTQTGTSLCLSFSRLSTSATSLRTGRFPSMTSFPKLQEPMLQDVRRVGLQNRDS